MKSSHKPYEIIGITSNNIKCLKKYNSENFCFNKDNFVVFNSLLHHRGVQNYSGCTKIVQFIRYSNLLDKKSIYCRWRFNEGEKKISIKLSNMHHFR